jgi:hypothetical protein
VTLAVAAAASTRKTRLHSSQRSVRCCGQEHFKPFVFISIRASRCRSDGMYMKNKVVSSLLITPEHVENFNLLKTNGIQASFLSFLRGL